jgi:hypothetical protein
MNNASTSISPLLQTTSKLLLFNEFENRIVRKIESWIDEKTPKDFSLFFINFGFFIIVIKSLMYEVPRVFYVSSSKNHPHPNMSRTQRMFHYNTFWLFLRVQICHRLRNITFSNPISIASVSIHLIISHCISPNFVLYDI